MERQKRNNNNNKAIIYKMPKIKTQLTELKKFIHQYENAQTDYEFQEAEKYLCKTHDQYGTIDIPTIRNLIKQI